MMALADDALYAAILANIGPVALAVTANLSFNVLRKPGASGLVCHETGRTRSSPDLGLQSDELRNACTVRGDRPAVPQGSFLGTTRGVRSA